MAQCKKHGYYACPHCNEKQSDNQPSGSPHRNGDDYNCQSHYENHARYARQVGIGKKY